MPQTKQKQIKSKISKANPTDVLLKIVHGDVDDLTIPHKSIITGKRVRNSILRKMIEAYRKFKIVDDTKLVDIILKLDESIEKELLTEGNLENIRQKHNQSKHK